MLNSRAEQDAAGSTTLPGTDTALSIVVVPIVASDRVVGRLILENHERENAYGEADVRLLTTVAASMGVALENARLFAETQRLLKETEQRNAELAVINSIQQGMAGSLDFQGIVDLVGDKLREVLGTPDLMIRWYDPKTNLNHYLYEFEHGRRLTVSPSPPNPGGIFETMTKTRQPVFFNTAADRTKLNAPQVPGSDRSKSSVYVPILGSDRVMGVIGTQSFERENAFGESEVRLLTTIAASMGVALENARLFDETQRLLKETEQRNAQLAVINSVQQGMSSLDFGDLVGDKLRGAAPGHQHPRSTTASTRRSATRSARCSTTPTSDPGSSIRSIDVPIVRRVPYYYSAISRSAPPPAPHGRRVDGSRADADRAKRC